MHDGYSSLNYIGVKIWNKIPVTIKSLLQYAFSKQYKNLLLHKYWKSSLVKIIVFLCMSIVELNHFNVLTCDFTSLCMRVLSSFCFCFFFIRSVLSKVAQLTWDSLI